MKKSISCKNNHSYYLAWLAISLFFLYQYILRVSPGIIVVELRQIYKLTAEEFSSLGAIYLYAYSLVQIPLGFILDRIGIRRVINVSIVLCIMGTLLFVYATNTWMLQIARLLIGLGSAPAFICAIKLIKDHLPIKHHGFLMGATLAIGTIGAFSSGKFLVVLIENTSWRNSLVICAGLGLLILLVIGIFVPSSNIQNIKKSSCKQLYEGLKAIFKRKEILLYSIIAISVYTPLCILADLWGTAFLIEKFNLNRSNAAQITLYMYGGLTVGSLILPWISLKWHLLKSTILVCALGLILALLILLYADTLSNGQLSSIMIMIGILCGAEMICFAGASQFAPTSHSGLTLGVVNTLNMLGGAWIQQGIGWYLDAHWQGNYGLEGARTYHTDELSAAFLILVFMMIGCSAMVLILPRKQLTE